MRVSPRPTIEKVLGAILSRNNIVQPVIAIFSQKRVIAILAKKRVAGSREIQRRVAAARASNRVTGRMRPSVHVVVRSVIGA
jgi:hypothetical protein